MPGFVVYIKAALALVLIKMTSLFKFMTNILVIMKNIITFAWTLTLTDMNTKSILMPHICHKIGWWTLLLTVMITLVKTILLYFFGGEIMDVAGYMARISHLILIISLSLICLSRENIEDEMISGLRLKAVGYTAWFFFIFTLVVSLLLMVQPVDSDITLYLSELFLICLPVGLAGLYLVIFKVMLWKSKKLEVL